MLKSILAAIAIGLALSAPVGAQTTRPLLMPETSSVYQRVLTRHGAALRQEPNGELIQRFPAFQPLYVFQRAEGWLQVGPSINTATGWIEEPDSILWKQNIVAAFTNAAGRQRQLMFEDQETLRNLMSHEAVRQMQAQLVDEADNGALPPDAHIVAAEPAEFVNIQDAFYLMPIFEHVEDLHPLTYESNLLMEVGSVPLREGESPAAAASSSPRADFDSGVVFVLDTTQSMEPYIQRTGQALTRIVSEIRGTDIGERINFGIYGFRDNPDIDPQIGYRTKSLAPLARRTEQTAVLNAIRQAEHVSPVSTPGFNEDSLAGVEDAIDQTDWTGGGDAFDGKYVILITDAGPKDRRDPNARSEIGPAELQRDAQDKGIVIMTLHLKTPNGGLANHEYAANKYRALSRFGPNEFYFPIEDGAEDAFETTVTRLITALTDHVRAARGQATVLSEQEAGRNLVALGLAMRLAYLGNREATQAPDVIRGWVSEKAVEDPSKVAFEPRLLITKNELATMGAFIGKLVELGETMRNSEDADSFFNQLQSAMAQMATDPNVMIDAQADTLGGALEYLERLPYRSQIMEITPEIWAQSGMQRRVILDSLRQKLVQYRKWLQDSDVWTALYDGAPDGEHVFAMPFDSLP